MTVAIVVESFNGQFAATLPGVPDLRAVRSTRGEAIEAVQAEIQKRLQTGELVTLEIPRRGVAAFGGAFRDDPTLRDICDEIYRQRDAEPYE